MKMAIGSAGAFFIVAICAIIKVAKEDKEALVPLCAIIFFFVFLAAMACLHYLS